MRLLQINSGLYVNPKHIISVRKPTVKAKVSYITLTDNREVECWWEYEYLVDKVNEQLEEREGE